MSKKELCNAYGISLDTFREWLLRAGIIGDNGLFTEWTYKKIRLFTPKQIECIYQAIGEPD